MPGIPDDLNEIFDAIIDGKRNLYTLALPLFGFVVTGAASATITYGHAATNAVAAANPVDVGIPISVPNGMRIVNVRVYLKDVNTQPAISAELRGTDRAGTFTTAAFFPAASAGNGTVQTLTLAATNKTIGSTFVGPFYLFLHTLTNATGTYSVYAVEVDLDRL